MLCEVGRFLKEGRSFSPLFKRRSFGSFSADGAENEHKNTPTNQNLKTNNKNIIPLLTPIKKSEAFASDILKWDSEPTRKPCGLLIEFCLTAKRRRLLASLTPLSAIIPLLATRENKNTKHYAWCFCFLG